MLVPVDRRRAAVITTSWPRQAGDASGHFVTAEVEQLLRSNYEVLVLAPGTTHHVPRGCHVIPLGGDALFGWPGALARLREDPRRALHAPRVILRAQQHLNKLAPVDHIVAHWLVPCAWPILAELLASRRGSSLLKPGGQAEVVAHGSDVRLLLKLPALLRNRILRQLCRADVHVRFVSRSLRDELLSARALPDSLGRELERRSSIRPAAIELPPLPSRLQARGQFGIHDDEWLIVVASRMVPDKRVDVALRAASLVPHSRIVALGSGPELDSLSAHFDNVYFAGQVSRPDALAWIRAADVVVSASRLEGAPTVIREARALGVPVVACPAGDLSEWARSDADLWLSSHSDELS